jgi:transcriptional regulator with XRE-family HTH domain
MQAKSRIKGQSESDRDALRKAIDAADVSLRKLAADAGVSDGTVRAFLDGRTEHLTTGTADKIAGALGTTWSAIIGRQIASNPGASRLRQLPVLQASTLQSKPNGLPVFQLHTDQAPVDVRRAVPPALVMSPRAFAFRVPSLDFAPRFQPGELVACDPDRTPGMGDDVLAKLKTGWVIGGLASAELEQVQLQVGRELRSIARANIDQLIYILRRGDFLGS